MIRLRLEGFKAGATSLPDMTVEEGERTCFDCSPVEGAALLMALAGLGREAEGAVWVDDMQATGSNVHVRRIAVVPADGGLLPNLTVRKNILYGVGQGQEKGPGIQTFLNSLTTKLQLSSALDRRPHELLSQALRLRVGLARAAISEPAVIVVHLPVSPEDIDELPAVLASAVVNDTAMKPAILVLTNHEEILDVFRRRETNR
jgi:ABC-type Na+ transport system ATPase subunit NatA